MVRDAGQRCLEIGPLFWLNLLRLSFRIIHHAEIGKLGQRWLGIGRRQHTPTVVRPPGTLRSVMAFLSFACSSTKSCDETRPASRPQFSADHTT